MKNTVRHRLHNYSSPYSIDTIIIVIVVDAAVPCYCHARRKKKTIQLLLYTDFSSAQCVYEMHVGNSDHRFPDHPRRRKTRAWNRPRVTGRENCVWRRIGRECPPWETSIGAADAQGTGETRGLNETVAEGGGGDTTGNERFSFEKWSEWKISTPGSVADDGCERRPAACLLVDRDAITKKHKFFRVDVRRRAPKITYVFNIHPLPPGSDQ